MRLLRLASAEILAGVALVVIALAAPAVGARSVAQAYHCGPYFHGHTIRGYLVEMKGTSTHLAYVPPIETLELWQARGISFAPCQK